MIRRYLIVLLLALITQAYAFDIDIKREPLNAGTGTQDITFSNFSQDCTTVTCAAIFLVTSAVSDGTAAADALLGIGYTDGTTSVSHSSRSDTGVTTTDTFRGRRTPTEVIHTTTFSTTEGYATFSSWLSNGVQINIVDAFAAQYLLTVVIIGGSDVSANVGVFSQNASIDGTTDVTTVGFNPSIVFLSGTRLGGTGDAGVQTFLLSSGVAVNDGSDTQGSIGCFAREGVTSSEVLAVSSTLYALQYIDDGGVDAGLQVSNWDTVGFTATTKNVALSGASGVAYLAVMIPGLNAAVLDIDTPISTGNDTVAVGFSSKFGMIYGTLAQAYDTGEADSDGGACMISVATADAQYSHMTHDEDAASTTNTGSISNDTFVQMEQDDGTCIAGSCFVGTLSSFGATDWTINYTSVFSDAVRKWVGLAIESPDITPSASVRRRANPIVFK